MEAITATKDLLEAAKVAQGTSGSNTMPMLNYAKIKANGQGLELFSTDLDKFSHVLVPGPTSHDGNPDESLVSTKALAKILKALKTSETLTISTSIKEYGENKTSATTAINGTTIGDLLTAYEVSDFPEYPTITDKRTLATFTGKEFKVLFKGLAKMACKDTETTRLALTTVNWQWGESKLRLTVTDGFHLLTKNLDCEQTEVGEIGANAQDLKRIATSISAKAEVKVSLAVGEGENPLRYLAISWDYSEILLREIVENYPDTNRIIPTATYPEVTEAIVSAGELSEALTKAIAFFDAADYSHAVEFMLTDSEIGITIPRNESFLESVSASIQFASIDPLESIALKAEYLQNYLAFCGDTNIKITLQAPDKPVKIVRVDDNEKDHTFVLMPVRLDG